MIRYEVIIYWSDEDEAFIADVPELPGCSAHGSTRETALSNAQDAVRLWIDGERVWRSGFPDKRTLVDPGMTRTTR
jgi:predicted RNase H-like HicB family nuclease